MNKIYKVIWSKAKHCYVVASELAKNHTKGCGKRSLRRTAVSLGIVATLLGGFSGSAWAALSAQTIDETHSGVTGGISVITGSSDEAGHIVTTNSDGDIVLLGGKTVKAYTLSAAEGGIVSYSGDLEIHSGDRTSPKTFFVDAATGNITVTGNYSTTNGNITTTNGTITGKDVTATGEVSGATATITGAVSVGGTLGVTGEATVGSLKIGTTSYGITSEGAATVSSLTIGTTAVDTAGLTGAHTIASGSTGYVSGATVNTKLADYTKNSAAAITGGSISGVSVDATSLKINGSAVDATGLTGNHTIIGDGGTGYVTGATVGTELANYAKADASNITVSDWATKLGAGTIASDSVSLVKGSTVYDYLNGTTSNPKLALGANSTNISIGKDNTNTGTDSWNNEQTGTEYIAIGQNIRQ